MLNYIDLPKFKNIYSDESLSSLMRCAELQLVVENLEKNTPESVAQTIFSTNIAASADGVRLMFSTIMDYYNSTDSEKVIELFKILISLQSADNQLGMIKDLLASIVFDPEYININLSDRLNTLFFFKTHWSEFGFTEEEIVEYIISFHQKSPRSMFSFSYLFIVFGEMLQRINPDFYRVAKRTHLLLSKQKRSLSDTFHNCACFSEEVWNNLEKAVNEGEFPSSVAMIIRSDDIDEFKKLCSIPTFNVNQCIDNITFLPLCSTMRSCNLIEYAAFCGSQNIFHFLIEKGVCLNLPTQNIFSIAQLAAKGGNTEIMKTLIRHKVNLEGIAHAALSTRKKELLEFAFHYLKISPSDYVNHLGTIVSQACCSGDILSMFLLLKCDEFDMNAKDNSSQTALHHSVRSGKLMTTKLLIEHPNCQIDVKDRSGNTVLHYAAENGLVDIMDAIIKKGIIDINDNNDLGYTPLMMATYRGKFGAIKYLCQQPGINVNAHSKWGMTALMYASQNGNPEVIDYLLSIPEIDINAKDSSGKTALHIAAEGKLKVIVETLLKSEKIDVNAMDSEGWTPLHLAAENDFSSIVFILANDPRIDVNAKDSHGMTPLHYAARNGKMKSINILMSHPRINPNERDSRGRAPIYYARSRPEVIEELMGYPNVEGLEHDDLSLVSLCNSRVIDT